MPLRYNFIEVALAVRGAPAALADVLATFLDRNAAYARSALDAVLIENISQLTLSSSSMRIRLRWH